MKIAARPLLVLHGNEAFRDRIRAVAGRKYQFQSLNDWPTLAETLRDLPPSALVVVDPYYDTADRRISPQLRAFTTEFPSIPVLAALEIGPDRSDDLIRLGKSGIMDVITIGHDDTPAALTHRLESAEGRPLKLLLDNVLPYDLPGRARAIIDAAARIVSAGEHGRDLAKALGLSRRTLLRWSESASLPPPRRLLAWMRILLAAEMLDDPGRTVIGVAQATGYSSDSGLRRVTMKFTQLSPTDLRGRGAFAAATKHFLRELERYRAAPAQPPAESDG